MRNVRLVTVTAMALIAAACAKKNDQAETPPADTATAAPAAAPMPMDSGMMHMDSAAHDSMMKQMPTTTK